MIQMNFFSKGQVALLVKNLPSNVGDLRVQRSIPGLGRSPGRGNGNPLQCFYLENSMARAAWKPTVHGIAKSRTRVSTGTHKYTHTCIYKTETDSQNSEINLWSPKGKRDREG